MLTINTISHITSCSIYIDPLTYFDAHFGETTGPVIWSNLACSGWETSIHHCNKDVFPNFNCTQQNTAGVTCTDSRSTLL